MLKRTVVLLVALATTASGQTPAGPVAAARALPTIAIDARLATDAHLRVGDTVTVASVSGERGDAMVIAATVARGADPSEVARAEYKVRLHLGDLQRLVQYGDRVDRFAMVTNGTVAQRRVVEGVNGAAFGFAAHRSRDVAVETGKTFAVVNRFHRAIGVITIVASAIFLLCIMLLKVEERRREMATLRLVGISRRTVVGTVVIEATAIAVLGSALGVGIGWTVSQGVNAYYQAFYRTPLVFSLVTGDVVLLAVSLSAALGIGAGWLAAQRLVQRPPLELMGR